jgi:hypothetical protein
MSKTPKEPQPTKPRMAQDGQTPANLDKAVSGRQYLAEWQTPANLERALKQIKEAPPKAPPTGSQVPKPPTSTPKSTPTPSVDGK